MPRRVSDLAARLSPLAALPFIAALRLPGIERDQPDVVLWFAAITAALCARGVYAWASPARAPADRRSESRTVRVGRALAVAARFAPPVLVAFLFAGYSVAMSWLAIENHHALRTRTFDLGFYDNIFYQTSHGRALGCSFLMGGTHLSGHFDPIFVVLSPLYLLHPRAELLLVLQSVWLGAGVVPVYLIAKRTLETASAGLVFAFLYVLYPALHGVSLDEFHSLSLIVPIVLFALYFLMTGAHRAYFAAVSLALVCREDVALLMCFVGLGALAYGRRKWVRTGLLTIAFSAAYFVIVKKWIMPSGELLNGGAGSYGYEYIYRDLIPNGGGARELVLSVLTNPVAVARLVWTPEKLRFVVELLLPLGFLPLFASRGRVMLIFGALYCLLASHFAVYSIHFHYASVVFPIAFALAPLGLRDVVGGRIGRGFGLDPARLRRAMLAGVVVASVLLSVKLGAFVDNASFRTATGPIARSLSADERDDYAWVEDAAAKIPQGASVGVSNRLGPHVSNRERVFFYPNGPKTDYVFMSRPDLRADDLARHDALVESGELVSIAERGDMALFSWR